MNHMPYDWIANASADLAWIYASRAVSAELDIDLQVSLLTSTLWSA